jgi:hypothetical protein
MPVGAMGSHAGLPVRWAWAGATVEPACRRDALWALPAYPVVQASGRRDGYAPSGDRRRARHGSGNTGPQRDGRAGLGTQRGSQHSRRRTRFAARVVGRPPKGRTRRGGRLAAETTGQAGDVYAARRARGTAFRARRSSGIRQLGARARSGTRDDRRRHLEHFVQRPVQLRYGRVRTLGPEDELSSDETGADDRASHARRAMKGGGQADVVRWVGAFDPLGMIRALAIRLLRCRRPRRIEVPRMSDAWLMEHERESGQRQDGW